MRACLLTWAYRRVIPDSVGQQTAEDGSRAHPELEGRRRNRPSLASPNLAATGPVRLEMFSRQFLSVPVDCEQCECGAPYVCFAHVCWLLLDSAPRTSGSGSSSCTLEFVPALSESP